LKIAGRVVIRVFSTYSAAGYESCNTAEEGAYALPFCESGEVRREITAQELAALLSGIDLNQAKRRKRYNRVA
jgi:hypothetical protein